MPTTPLPASTPPRGYTTDQAASILLARPNTLRVALCERGEYLGVRPVKLPNRRLVWPADQVDAVARGESPPPAPPTRPTRARRTAQPAAGGAV
ncbi:hypothetical protein [uncultured Lamprocystis sp.]|jgi:hypothetical protein|uniref:hypothetical protein n=1 Tax=uncultured Lamprocystis sp. TaxID=543132 RepID=UPI0025D81673|nr:hypothetical protein [uncultured Lamprocystis sp.]